MFGIKDRFRNVSSSLAAAGPSPVAMDFGTAGIKLAQIMPGEPPGLIAAAFLPTPEHLLAEPAQRLAWQIEQLPGLVRSAGFKGRRAICGIPTSQAYCKHLQVQAAEPRALATEVAATLAGQLGCAPEAVVCRHIEVGPAPCGGGKIEVIGIAAARGMVQRLIGAVRAARLELVGLQPECIALLRSFDHVSRRTTDHQTTSLYLDIGCGSTRVVIAHGSELVFAKTIGLGGHVLDTLVARQLKIPLEQAHGLRLAEVALSATPPMRTSPAHTAPAPHAGPQGDGMAALRAAVAAAGGPAPTGPTSDAAVAEAERREGKPLPGCMPLERTPATLAGPKIDLREPVDTLTDEITMCLRYHDSLFPGRRLTRTIFVGGESRHAALCQHVARVLRAPASIADPGARASRTAATRLTGVDFSQPQPGWAVPIGLCLSPTDL